MSIYSQDSDYEIEIGNYNITLDDKPISSGSSGSISIGQVINTITGSASNRG